MLSSKENESSEPTAGPATALPNALDKYRFDEYRFFASSTQHLSERRQAATRTYLTVNTAIFGAMAFFIQYAEFKGWQLVAIGYPMFVIGLGACWTWERIIARYKQLISWRYDQLMEMERRMPQCHQMYLKEYKRFFEPRPSEPSFGFSVLEVNLPWLFAGLYLIYALILLSIVVLP